MVKDLIPRTGVVLSRLLPGPAGRLDARLHGPDDGPPALVLHPHPLYGGTMGSRLVYDVTAALASAGHRAVRFDYRGVGRSEGTYGNGVGEADDARAVLDVLRAEAAGEGRAPAQAPVDLVGYSFGGAVALHVAARHPDAVRRLVLVATPPRLRDAALDPMADAPRVQAPTLLVTSDADPFFLPTEAAALARAFRPPARHDIVPGGAHFLQPSHNADVAARVVAFLASRSAP